jgi:integrase/recombinase XerD
MLERLFDCPAVLQRLRANLLGDVLEEYTIALRAQGYLRSTLRDHVWALEHFGSWLHRQRRSLQDVNNEQVRSFLHKHLPACHCPAPAPADLSHVRPALNQLLRLLRERGRARLDHVHPDAHDSGRQLPR